MDKQSNTIPYSIYKNKEDITHTLGLTLSTTDLFVGFLKLNLFHISYTNTHRILYPFNILLLRQKISFSASDDSLRNLKMSLMRKVNLSDGKTVWECVQCGKRHFNKSNIVQHVDTHIEGVKYICDFCQKHFKSQGSLNVHVTIKHREEKRRDANQNY